MTMPKEYDASFECSRGKTWNIKFRLSGVLKFCDETGKKLEDLLPTSLNESELIKLSFLGIQHHADAKGIDWEMWIDEHLDGDAYAMCRDATVLGVLNFILPKLPEKMRVLLRHTLDASLQTAEESMKEVVREVGGLGPMSATSAQEQEKSLEGATTASES